MENKNKKSVKVKKSYKYYYTKASVIRSVVECFICLSLFFAFFVCFMIYGGDDRDPNASFRQVYDEEKRVYSMIDGVAADGEGRVYAFYSRTFEINAYDENGVFLESYQIPSNGEVSTYDGGIVCREGKLYAFNDGGDVFVYDDGKYVSRLDVEKQWEECKSIYDEYEKSKNAVETDDGKVFLNNYLSIMDGEGNIIVGKFFVGLLFSPFSMLMSIIMTTLTFLSVRRYNRKVRNQKIKTIFKNSITVK